MHSPLSLEAVPLSINLSNIEFEKNRERQESNQGRVGWKHEHYVSGMPSPPSINSFHLIKKTEMSSLPKPRDLLT